VPANSFWPQNDATANPTIRITITAILHAAVSEREHDISGHCADDQVMPAVNAHGQRRG
jgi:hypothetical protein